MLKVHTSLSRTLRTTLRYASTNAGLVEVTLPSNSFTTYNMDAPSLTYMTSKDNLLKMYKDMFTIRRMEIACDELYKAKEIRGFCHLSTGQEAIATGIENAINKKDSVITSYRCHGFTYLRVGNVKSVVGELIGRQNGLSHGKGGSMHMFAPGFFGGNGIVGAQVPIGTGLAFAHKYLNDKGATFTLYGDGAANQGQIAESFNMAKLWNLPSIYCCENNGYGMGTAASRASAKLEYYERGQYFPGMRVQGMDVLSVYQAAKFAKDWVLNDKGPLLIEFDTYRYGGHSMSDPGTSYRTREEVQEVRATRDPIVNLKTYLLENEITDKDTLKKIEKDQKAYVKREVKEAQSWAKPAANLETLSADTYIKGHEVPKLRGRISEDTWDFEKGRLADTY